MNYCMGDFATASLMSSDITPMGETTPVKYFVENYGVQILTIGILILGLTALTDSKKTR